MNEILIKDTLKLSSHGGRNVKIKVIMNVKILTRNAYMLSLYNIDLLHNDLPIIVISMNLQVTSCKL